MEGEGVSEKSRVSVGKVAGRLSKGQMHLHPPVLAMRVDQQRDRENPEPGIGMKLEVVDL